MTSHSHRSRGVEVRVPNKYRSATNVFEHVLETMSVKTHTTGVLGRGWGPFPVLLCHQTTDHRV